MNLLEKAIAQKQKTLPTEQPKKEKTEKNTEKNEKSEGFIIPEILKKANKLKLGTTLSKKTKKLQIASTPTTSNAPLKKGRIFAFVGKHGTGKTFACCNFAKTFKKTLYIDLEYKASEVFDEQYPYLKYDMKEPIKDDNKNHSQIFKDDSDVHIDVAQKINETTGQRDDIATAKYIINNTPLYIQLIKSGKYRNLIIDSCSPIWEYTVKIWLKRNKRQRVTQYEYQEVEAIRQEILLPFINYCKIYNVNLILTFGIAGHYINDILIGYKEDVKQWLLNIFSYELWFEYDYSKYCLKHPYRPFWVIKDEDLNISEYLFDKEFIDEGDEIEFKDFEDFKYESMTSAVYRATEDKNRKNPSSLTIG